MRWILFLLLIPTVFADCTIPESGMQIEDDTILCVGNFTITEPINFVESAILNCNDTKIFCDGDIYGITSYGSDLALTGCRLSYCEQAVHVENNNIVEIIDSWFTDNIIGVSVENSENVIITDSFFRNKGNSLLALNSKVQPLDTNKFSIPPTIIGEYVVPVEPPAPEPAPVGIMPPVTYTENIVHLGQEAQTIIQDIVRTTNTDNLFDEYLASVSDFELIRTVRIFNGTTDIRINIVPLKPLQELTLYEIIPKCFAEYVNEIIASKEYEVFKEDPLIAWHFNSLTDPISIEYTVNNELTDECILQTIAIAKPLQVEKKPPIYQIAGVILAILILAFLVLRSKKRDKDPFM